MQSFPSSSSDAKGKMKRMVSSAQGGLKGLRFLDKAGGRDGWKDVEKRFDQFAVERRLLKENFGPCIGEFCPDSFSFLACN